MDAVSFHSLWTLAIFISMIGIILWAFNGKRKADFEEAANLVFADEQKEKTGEDKQ